MLRPERIPPVASRHTNIALGTHTPVLTLMRGQILEHSSRVERKKLGFFHKKPQSSYVDEHHGDPISMHKKAKRTDAKCRVYREGR
jgi:hypothetical protein